MSQQAKIKGKVTAGGMIINRCGVSREHKPLSCSLVLLIKTFSLSLPSDCPLSTCDGRQTCTPWADLVTRHCGHTAGVLGKIYSSCVCYQTRSEKEIVPSQPIESLRPKKMVNRFPWYKQFTCHQFFDWGMKSGVNLYACVGSILFIVYCRMRLKTEC